MEIIQFTVDAALLRELGERLVGRPYIALAELVKNSYDADATEIVLRFTGDTIEVTDNGTGMTSKSFEDFWMRIGSPHKQTVRTSPIFGRPLTGSKGVGRLAVQFLANHLALTTVSATDTSTEIHARVNWAEAVAASSLTTAHALWEDRPRIATFAKQSPYGTRLVLSELHHSWTRDLFEQLARELWSLEPPFGVPSDEGGFHITLIHPDARAIAAFRSQMRAVLDIWTAKISGRLLPTEQPPSTAYPSRTVEIMVEFRGGSSKRVRLKMPECAINDTTYEIRVFSLRYRQPRGISVTEARDYLRTYGGVGVYDAGFRLPYYGADVDWLNIARDVGRRLSTSALLPEELQVSEGLQYLPPNERLYGVVRINTSEERHSAELNGTTRESLAIQVTRDRLVDNRAYQDLVRMVRYGIDLYANEEAARAHARDAEQSPIAPLRERANNVAAVLARHAKEIPPAVTEELTHELNSVIESSQAEADELVRQTSILGTLATAGIAAVAYEHEAAKQLTTLEKVANGLRAPGVLTTEARLTAASNIDRWVEQSRATRALFGHLMNESQRTARRRYRLDRVIRQIAGQLAPLTPGLQIRLDAVPDSFRLPPATFAEWTAVFQNLFVNAANATVDVAQPEVQVSVNTVRSTQSVLVSDNGTGVNLSNSEALFKPFVRRAAISADRQRLGLGGTGLGLTIVRMITRQLEVRVSFAQPQTGYKTTVVLSWVERTT